jgi:hypothetical protein
MFQSVGACRQRSPNQRLGRLATLMNTTPTAAVSPRDEVVFLPFVVDHGAPG